MFWIKNKAQVLTKSVTHFLFLKFYNSFISLNNFLYFICYLAAQQLPTYVKYIILIPSSEVNHGLR